MANVSVREVTDADLEVLFEYQADPASAAMAGVAARDREAYAAHQAKLAADPDIVRRAIVRDGDVVGDLVSWRADGGRREVGYRIGQAYWGQGIATAAFTLFLAELDERPLYAHVLKNNAASMRVLEKCGFVPLADEERIDDDSQTDAFRLS